MLSHFSDVLFFGVVGLGLVAIAAFLALASRTDTNRAAYQGSKAEQFRDRVIAVSPALPFIVVVFWGVMDGLGQQDWMTTVAIGLFVLGIQLPPIKRARERLSSGSDYPAQ